MEDKLNCQDFEERIHQLLDQRLAVNRDDQLSIHVRRCARCAELLDDYTTLAPMFSDNRSIGNSCDSTVSVVQIRSAWTPFSVTVATIAALLLIGLGVFSVDLDSDLRDYRLQASSVKLAGSGETGAVGTGAIIPVLIAAVDFQSNDRSMFDSKNPAVYHPSLRSQRFSQILQQSPPTLFELVQSTPELVSSTPQFVTSVAIASTNSWERLANRLEPLNPYWHYSVEIPGVRPLQTSVNLTLDLFQRSLSKPNKQQPNLGWFPELAATEFV